MVCGLSRAFAAALRFGISGARQRPMTPITAQQRHPVATDQFNLRGRDAPSIPAQLPPVASRLAHEGRYRRPARLPLQHRPVCAPLTPVPPQRIGAGPVRALCVVGQEVVVYILQATGRKEAPLPATREGLFAHGVLALARHPVGAVILETVRIIADWLGGATYGINAVRIAVPKDSGVTDFPAVTVIDGSTASSASNTASLSSWKSF
jgi:hypothetical protein